jgi:ABC-type oligopeptide transport system substrate-binding subunit
LNQTLYDPARAQSYLATAGFANCAGLPESLILLVPDDEPVWTEVGNFITQQWATTLGCNPSLFEVKAVSRTLLIELAHANYDPEKVTRSHMWLVTWNADYLDANAWLYDALHCHYGFIRSGRPCEPGDNLLDQAALESDPGARATLYTETEETFFGANGTFPVAPLYMTTSAWLQQPWLTGVNAYGPARFDLWIIDTAGQSS